MVVAKYEETRTSSNSRGIILFFLFIFCYYHSSQNVPTLLLTYSFLLLYHPLYHPLYHLLYHLLLLFFFYYYFFFHFTPTYRFDLPHFILILGSPTKLQLQIKPFLEVSNVRILLLQIFDTIWIWEDNLKVTSMLMSHLFFPLDVFLSIREPWG